VTQKSEKTTRSERRAKAKAPAGSGWGEENPEKGATGVMQREGFEWVINWGLTTLSSAEVPGKQLRV
jgi:hypothetical protein